MAPERAWSEHITSYVLGSAGDIVSDAARPVTYYIIYEFLRRRDPAVGGDWAAER